MKKINIDPNEIIKIEAADDDDDEQCADTSKSKTKETENTASSDTGIKIASVTGATETSITAGTSQPATANTGESIVCQTAPLSSAPSPLQTSTPATPSSLPVLSPFPKDEASNSSASTLHSEPTDTKINDTVPPEGLSLDSDLSKLTGIPGDSIKSDQNDSNTGSSTGSVSQAAPSQTNSNVNVKLEALTEPEMELEITGVEPGQMTQADNNFLPNVQNRMGFGPSTSGMADLGDMMNPDYSKYLIIYNIFLPVSCHLETF